MNDKAVIFNQYIEGVFPEKDSFTITIREVKDRLGVPGHEPPTLENRIKHHLKLMSDSSGYIRNSDAIADDLTKIFYSHQLQPMAEIEPFGKQP